MKMVGDVVESITKMTDKYLTKRQQEPNKPKSEKNEIIKPINIKKQPTKKRK
jgi:hypothetical protein